jgi:diacylglycerol kinase (ATP)
MLQDVSVVLVLNPHSRANRRDPGMATRLGGVLGDAGRVISAASLAELADAAVELARRPPAAIAIHGGDGTLHKSLAALLRAAGSGPLPPIAILPGGTMNVVASSLRLLGRPEAIATRLGQAVRAGAPLPTCVRRCLRVGDTHGFVFGNGLMANFLEEYYATDDYGPTRAMWLLLRTFSSALVKGSYASHIFRRFDGTVTIDGTTLPGRRFTGIGAATVREVGLGFKLNHRADEHADRFSVLAIHAGPLSLSRDLVAVHRGRGIAPSRARSEVASSLRIEPDSGESVYTIDGDLYRSTGPIEIGLGPPIRFFCPAGS